MNTRFRQTQLTCVSEKLIEVNGMSWSAIRSQSSRVSSRNSAPSARRLRTDLYNAPSIVLELVQQRLFLAVIVLDHASGSAQNQEMST